MINVTIPNSVTSIGYRAFGSCAGLTNVTIPNSVTSIGECAFTSCTSLSNVTIPNGVSNIGKRAFCSCTSLSAITVDAANAYYSSMDGGLFNKSTNTLIQCPGGKAGSYTIPNSVTGIGDLAFYYCTNLTSVTIPDSVTSIGWNAFDSCTTLTGVYFQGNAPSLGSYVFDHANNVIVYYLPGSTGWGTTFGGRPTALWKPQVQTTDASFGVRTNRFGFNITWASGRVIVVEACTNLSSGAWCPLRTNTISGDTLYFSDPQWTNYSCRFYRIRSP